MSGQSYTREDLLEAFLALLPSGDAWPKEHESAMKQTLRALMVLPEHTAARAAALLDETFPATTFELLPEWEWSLGLPDECQSPDASMQARRNQVIARFANQGSGSVDSLIAHAKSLGYDITVTEFWPTTAGMQQAGQPLNADGAQHCLLIRSASATTDSVFTAGESAAGEFLEDFSDNVLECELNAIKPAHVKLIFAYGP